MGSRSDRGAPDEAATEATSIAYAPGRGFTTLRWADSGSNLLEVLYEAGPVAPLSSDAAAERLFAPGGIVRQGMLREWVMPVTLLAPVVYGIALVRAGMFSRWAGWLVIAFIPAFFALNGVLALLPPTAREDLLDLGYANFGLGVSYLLLNAGLAIAGYQVWSLLQPGSESPGTLAPAPKGRTAD